MPVIAVTSSRQGRGHVQSYTKAIEGAGGEARVLLPGVGLHEQDPLEGVHGLLLTGGADIDPHLYSQAPRPETEKPDRRRDEFELSVIKAALVKDMPVLAICRGIQLLNVALGGALIQHVPEHAVKKDGDSTFHEIFIAPGSKLAVVVGQGHGGFPWVNSRHHQGIKQHLLAAGLRATAYAPRDGIIEAVESHAHRFVIGVQWHPEREEDYQPRGVMHPKFRRLFDALVGEAGVYRKRLTESVSEVGREAEGSL